MTENTSLFDGYVNSDEFPPWFYAEIEAGSGEKRVVSLFHVPTPVGNVVYWYDDPENPQRTMPLLKAMKPVNLGDYGAFLQRSDHMSIFVALCKSIEDLPDPLHAVQIIHWVTHRQQNRVGPEVDLRAVVLLAMNAMQEVTKRRRAEFEYMMRVLAGVGSSAASTTKKTASA